MTAWQPIETAPRDGTFVILCAFDVILDGGIRYTSDPYCSWRFKDSNEWAGWPHRFPPTHWLPLPEPPDRL